MPPGLFVQRLGGRKAGSEVEVDGGSGEVWVWVGLGGAGALNP